MGLKTSKLQRLNAAITAFKTKLSNDKVAVKQEAVAEAVQTVTTSGGSGSGGGSTPTGSTVDWANVTNKPAIPTFTVSGTSLHITT